MGPEAEKHLGGPTGPRFSLKIILGVNPENQRIYPKPPRKRPLSAQVLSTLLHFIDAGALTGPEVEPLSESEVHVVLAQLTLLRHLHIAVPHGHLHIARTF